MSSEQTEAIRFAQITITNQQAYLLAVAADEAADRGGISDQAKDNLERLSVFLYDVSTDPEDYPVTDPKARAMIRTLLKAAKGPAQPQTRKNRRKERQAKRQGFAKRRRRERAAFVKAWNEAVEKQLADAAEAEEYYEQQEAMKVTFLFGDVQTDNTLDEKIREAETPGGVILP